jgi:hypothetical protein
MTSSVTRRPQGGSATTIAADKAENGLSSASQTAAAATQQQHHSSKANPHPHGRKSVASGKAETPSWVYASFVLFSAISIVFFPRPFQPPHGTDPSLQHVFYYGWLTALSTGLGALPFCLVPKIASYWVGVSNGPLLRCRRRRRAMRFELLSFYVRLTNDLFSFPALALFVSLQRLPPE